MDATATLNKEVSAKGSLMKVFRIEDVSVSIFSRDHEVNGEMITFYSVSFSRSYKTDDGKRKYTKSFDSDDLGALMSLAKQASEFIQSQNGLTTEPQED